jgi:hypothetical protein
MNGKYKTTSHSTIMEQLRIKAERFRKQGRLQNEDLEEIMQEIKESDQPTNKDKEHRETLAKDEHQKVQEAVKEGLLQIHGSTPNTKQSGMFRIMGENCNGFNNRISGNEKIAKALDIKDDLDIDRLLYCEHQINFRYKDNRMT